MTLTAARQGLVTRLQSIPGLRVYDTPLDAAPELPAAIVMAGEPLASYQPVLGAADVRYLFAVLLLVRSGDDTQAWADLEPYVSPTGASSVRAAVDGNLGGSADWARVRRANSAGRVTYHRSPYWGVTFQVEVHQSG